MVFAWKDYLELARLLKGHDDDSTREAALRSAVSRAYFAAYCHARNYARDNLGYQVRPDDSGDHGRLRARLKEQHMFDVARRLDSLRQWRNVCDYEDSVASDLAQLAGSAISEAKKVIDRL